MLLLVDCVCVLFFLLLYFMAETSFHRFLWSMPLKGSSLVCFEMLGICLWSAVVHFAQNRVKVWVDVYYRKACLTFSNEYAWSRSPLISINNLQNTTCLHSFDKIQYVFSAASCNPFFEKENNNKCNAMQ